jgi:peroxiredoxin (alkyl hydroperoxide reductase subunit C)
LPIQHRNRKIVFFKTNQEQSMSHLIGNLAPSFTTSAVVEGCKIVENFSLENYRGQHVVLFFYPLDFTFVCPTELHAFQEQSAAFQQRNTAVIGCSVDSAYAHYAWLRTPKASGGIEGVEYPLVSDLTKSISESYGVLIPEAGVALRGLFLIDKEGIVRHQIVNDLPLGRSVDEALRMVDALQFFEVNGEVCPANWKKGATSMAPTQEGLEQFYAQVR